MAILARFNLHFFILAENKDMHEMLDEFEFKPDPTIDCGVTCPWASGKSMYNVFVTSDFYTGIFFSVNEWSICFSKANSNYFQGKQLTNFKITGLYLHF